LLPFHSFARRKHKFIHSLIKLVTVLRRRPPLSLGEGFVAGWLPFWWLSGLGGRRIVLGEGLRKHGFSDFI
jgi:hypothetical protein